MKEHSREARERGKSHRERHNWHNEQVRRNRDEGEIAGIVKKEREDRDLCGERGRDDIFPKGVFQEREKRFDTRREPDEPRGRRDGEAETGVEDEIEWIPQEHKCDDEKKRATGGIRAASARGPTAE